MAKKIDLALDYKYLTDINHDSNWHLLQNILFKAPGFPGAPMTQF